MIFVCTLLSPSLFSALYSFLAAFSFVWEFFARREKKIFFGNMAKRSVKSSRIG